MLLPVDDDTLTDEARVRAAGNRLAAKKKALGTAAATLTFGSAVVHLAYDRGLSGKAIVELELYGIAVHTPDMRVDSQLAHSVASMTKNRDVATERVNIERVNREFRLHKGFDSQSRLDQIDLADSEAQVARGLANLNRELQDWAVSSGLVVGGGAAGGPAPVFKFDYESDY